MTEKRYSFNWERGHPNFWDNHCDLADCYLTCEDVVKRLNELNDENEQLKEENQFLNKQFNIYRDASKRDAREIKELMEDIDELHGKNQAVKDIINELNSMDFYRDSAILDEYLGKIARILGVDYE